MTLACVAFAAAGARFGLAGYIGPLALTTFGYSLFQTANNKLLMGLARPDEKGMVSGMLNLARNLGLITGATAMAAVFASTSGAAEPAHASAENAVAGMRETFAIAGAVAFRALVAGFLEVGDRKASGCRLRLMRGGRRQRYLSFETSSRSFFARF